MKTVILGGREYTREELNVHIQRLEAEERAEREAATREHRRVGALLRGRDTRNVYVVIHPYCTTGAINVMCLNDGKEYKGLWSPDSFVELVAPPKQQS
jgi:hypothetical protein